MVVMCCNALTAHERRPCEMIQPLGEVGVAELPKIAVLETAREAYRLVFAEFGLFLRLAWFPTIVVALIEASPLLMPPMDNPVEPELQSLGSWHWGLILLKAFESRTSVFGENLDPLVVLVFAPVATSWHRAILLREEGGSPRIGYAFRREEFLFIKTYIVIVIAALIVQLVLLMTLGFPLGIVITGAMAVLSQLAKAGSWLSDTVLIPLLAGGLLLSTILLVINGALIVRMALALPSAAIGKPIGIFSSGEITSHNTIRLLVLVALTEVPLMSVEAMLTDAAESAASPMTAHLLSSAVFAVSNALYVVMAAGCLSLSYKVLIENLTPEPEPEPGTVG